MGCHNLISSFHLVVYHQGVHLSNKLPTSRVPGHFETLKQQPGFCFFHGVATHLLHETFNRLPLIISNDTSYARKPFPREEAGISTQFHLASTRFIPFNPAVSETTRYFDCNLLRGIKRCDFAVISYDNHNFPLVAGGGVFKSLIISLSPHPSEISCKFFLPYIHAYYNLVMLEVLDL